MPTALYANEIPAGQIYGAAASPPALTWQEQLARFAAEWREQVVDLLHAEISDSLDVHSVDPRVALQQIREWTKWSLREVGEVIGLSHTQVARLMNGEHEPRKSILARILDLHLMLTHLRLRFPAPIDLTRSLTQPLDGEVALEALREGNIGEAMRRAMGILRPQPSGIVNVEPAKFLRRRADQQS